MVSERASARLDSSDRPLLSVAAAFFLFQAAVTAFGQYGYFIDEFYYIACARRPAFGYVDHPPLAPLVLALTRAVLGESLLAIRLPAFFAGAVVVWASGRIARELGGDRWTELATAVTVALAPGVLGMAGFFSVNAFEIVAWVLCTWALVRLLKTGDTRLWVVIGAILGLGFESKHTVVTLAAALAAGVALTPARRLLWNRHALAGGLVAAALAMPNVAWQIAHGFPSLEFYRNAATLKNLPSPPLTTVVEQLRIMGLFTWAIWGTGLAWLLCTREGGRWRALGLAYLVLLVLLILSHQSRPDRLIGIYPVLISAGFVVLARVARTAAVRALVLAILALGSVPAIPVVVGILPPHVLAPYVAWLGIQTSAERGKTSPIPQLLADRTGWEAFVDQVAGIYESLPEQDRQRALIYASSYGQAGAIDVLGRSRGLPRTIAGQNSYWHWSQAEGVDTDVLIAVDADPDDLRLLFRDVQQAGTTRCTYCMSWRNGMPIYVARGSIRPVHTLWAQARHYE